MGFETEGELFLIHKHSRGVTERFIVDNRIRNNKDILALVPKVTDITIDIDENSFLRLRKV